MGGGSSNNHSKYSRRRVWAQAYAMTSKSLQQEVDEDSCDATVVMKDDAELDTYSMSEEVHEDSDAMVAMKDDAELNITHQVVVKQR
jgi:hypothetical protein